MMRKFWCLCIPLAGAFYAGNSSELVRRGDEAARVGRVGANVQPQGDIEIESSRSHEDMSDAGEVSTQDTDPLVAKMAGKWKVKYDGWSNNAPFHDVTISGDGKWTIWTNKASKIEMGEKKDKICTKGTHKIQFLVPSWNRNDKKWECGWYDEKADKIHTYHYYQGSLGSGHGHSKGDNYWGKEDCPTPKPAEKSNSVAMCVSLLPLIVLVLPW